MEAPVVQPIEERMSGNIQLALSEGGLYFDKQGSVWNTLQRIVRVLDERGIPYAVIGALAMFHHGYRRYTHNVDLLVARDRYAEIEPIPSGFIRPRPHVQIIVDRETGVSVKLSREGDFSGDVEDGIVRFPHPESVPCRERELSFVDLPTLVSLKLGAWISDRCRLRDFADVQEMIKTLCLTEYLAERLHPGVRSEFIAMCRTIDEAAGEFLLLWELQPNAQRPLSMGDLIASDPSQGDALKSMHRDGVVLHASRPHYQEFAVLVTRDRTVARKFDMHHESEYLLDGR